MYSPRKVELSGGRRGNGETNASKLGVQNVEIHHFVMSQQTRLD